MAKRLKLDLERGKVTGKFLSGTTAMLQEHALLSVHLYRYCHELILPTVIK